LSRISAKITKRLLENICDFIRDLRVSHTVYGLSNFIQLAADWLKSEPPALESDVNGDGIVNTRDLGIMMSNWSD